MYIEALGNNENLIIPFKDNKNFSSNYIFPIVLKKSNKEKRDEVRNKLAEAGIQTSVHYPAVHRFSIYQDYNTYLPNTDYISDNLITLPLYSSLNEQQVKLITASLKEILFNVK
jgi:dTDP-4-amino-4,6-dideoxygalactose transaminase